MPVKTVRQDAEKKISILPPFTTSHTLEYKLLSVRSDLCQNCAVTFLFPWHHIRNKRSCIELKETTSTPSPPVSLSQRRSSHTWATTYPIRRRRFFIDLNSVEEIWIVPWTLQTVRFCSVLPSSKKIRTALGNVEYETSWDAVSGNYFNVVNNTWIPNGRGMFPGARHRTGFRMY